MNRLIILLIFCVSACTDQDPLKKPFRDPPNDYRPMPFLHLNGHLTREGIEKTITGAGEVAGFGGIAVLPVSEGKQWGGTGISPGMTPEYLSDAYFERYADMLEVSRQRGMQIIVYDDIDFPSGSAGGRLQREYPQYTRKYVTKEEHLVGGNRHVSLDCPVDERDPLIAASAMNTKTLQVVDLEPSLKGSKLEWNAPAGKWRVMFFRCGQKADGAHSNLVDYMQPEAVAKVIEMTYDEYGKRFGEYFGKTITKTFFDDVGFVHQENTWTPAITRIFREKYGKNPSLYYPALYYDIGPETQAARVAFYDIRSELMAEGYVKQVSEWAARHQVSSMGHPPENYSPNSVVANGDILKYYRHVQIPLLDAIFFYGRGVHGFKQVSSAADLGDKPLVGAELCGAFPADMDSLTLFRTTMEALVRGVNFVVPHGMWYDPEPGKIRIPPLISPENPLLAPCLTRYNAYVGRSCLLLQGGRRVSDIAVLWPIHAIQAETWINRDANSGLPVANWVPEGVNHQQLSDLLTNQLRRDFTFIHPEDLTNGKVIAEGRELKLNNTVNEQHYEVLIMPGGEVISVATLKAIKEYYERGGKVIVTASLPSRSAEFGQDSLVKKLVADMFFIDPEGEIPPFIFERSVDGGQCAFIKNVSTDELERLFGQMEISADVYFKGQPLPENKVGCLNYIHKQKDGRDIWLLTNTTENLFENSISLRGSFEKLECWDPHTGKITPVSPERKKTREGMVYTDVSVSLPAVSSLFLVGYLGIAK
ncbi:MAG: glycosyl hydrolase [Prolixibacteraceae bacterium]